MKQQPIIFISEPINAKGLAMLKDKAVIVQAPDTTKATAMDLVKTADAVILRATTIFDEDVIAAGSKLRIIARTGVGIDNVDLKAAGEKGIPVCNTPGTNDETVAEHALAIILALSKQIIIMDKAVRQQRWGERFSPKQMDISGKKIGIIGYGRIGKAIAKKCRLLGMHITVYDPFVEKADDGAFYAGGMDEIFAECDFVTLHCPSTPATRNMVNAHTLSLMKKTAYLVNTSRGDLVDEKALLHYLQNGLIAGAALDVFKEEPLYAGHPFFDLDNLILSPHIAGSTKESNERIAVAAVQAVLDVLEGKTPLHICNQQYLKTAIIND